MRATGLVLVFCLGSVSWAVQAQSGRSREWLTWGGDIERTGWNRGETTLSKQNVGRLGLKWKTQIDKEVSIEIESGNSMLTTPLVAQGVRTPQGLKTVVYTLSAVEYAGGARRRNGRVDLAAHRSTTPSSRRSTPNWICTNTSTATPVIDKAKGIIYMLAADGRLHGVDLATGEAKVVPPPEFVTPFSRNWSLNLVDGVLYTTVGRGCGNGPVPGAPAPPPGTIRGAGAPPRLEMRHARRAPAEAARARRRAGRRGAGPRPRPRSSAAAGCRPHDRDGPEQPRAPDYALLHEHRAAERRVEPRGHGVGASIRFFVQTADGAWDPPKACGARRCCASRRRRSRCSTTSRRRT